MDSELYLETAQITSSVATDICSVTIRILAALYLSRLAEKTTFVCGGT